MRVTTWPDLSGRIMDGKHLLPVRVYYEDTDFTGIVYHGAYVQFFERGRSDFLRLANIHHSELKAGVDGASLAFAVRKMNIEFFKPATIDDVLEVRTVLEEQKGARIALRQEILREGTLLVSADVLVAVITEDGRPTRLPLHLAQRLAQLGSAAQIPGDLE
ncbi:tol-pal system-associated acyl-CoA thioesterase [Labrenzia polysiphoniae]|uniref:Tol-pal system-associated acyl-CoA thioesterase n=1 Tax=Roseibium polysiphoniae TaxID=2571221 RepID=A0ABR9CAE2_9HYPH|nr:tol-pal system-associated acyl-CoA thioesterase [Roseibium polysiphoniae]